MDLLEKYCLNKNLVFKEHTIKKNKFFFFNFKILNDNYEEILFRLLKYNYIIFLTDYFYNLFNIKLLTYFNKYDVVTISYNDRENIINNLNILNNFIKDSSKKDKDLLCFDIYEIYNIDIKKLKTLYFYENIIEPNTLYKKISFSKEEQFLSFENYSIKKTEYKLRTFCQIAEKLGAKSIIIHQETSTEESIKQNIDVNTESVDIGFNNSTKNNSNSIIDLNFDYTNYYYNLSLNKFFLIEMIKEENEFFITNDDFEADLDLKFLIDARCINLIKKYNTKIIINKLNELERKLFIKAKDYGLNIDYNKHKSYSNFVFIEVIFFNIYDKYECIDGYNIYNMKEGFWHLSNIIKKEIKILEESIENYDNENQNNIKKNMKSINCSINNTINGNNTINTDKISKINNLLLNNFKKTDFYVENNRNIYKNIYKKIGNFLDSHLKTISSNYNILQISSKNISNNNYLNIYNIILKKNFSQHEIDDIIYNCFHQNLYYEYFESFRNKIILHDYNDNVYDIDTIIKNYFIKYIDFSFFDNILTTKDSSIDKLSFINAQYYLINKNIVLYKNKYKNILFNNKKINDIFILFEGNVKEKYLEFIYKHIEIFLENNPTTEAEIFIKYFSKVIDINNEIEENIKIFIRNNILNIVKILGFIEKKNEFNYLINNKFLFNIYLFCVDLIKIYYIQNNDHEEFVKLFILKTEYKDINYGNLNIFMKWEEFKNFFIELNDKNLIEKKGTNYTISNKSSNKLTLHSMKDDFIDSFNDEKLN